MGTLHRQLPAGARDFRDGLVQRRKWVTRNAEALGAAARVGRCKGLAFDCEPYGKDPWTYGSQKHAEAKTFVEYQAMVRQRGAEFLSAVQSEFPAPIIHTFYLLNLYTHPARNAPALEPDPARRQEKLEASLWNLWPAFVNGMLDAANSDTIITDGNDDAYYYVHTTLSSPTGEMAPAGEAALFDAGSAAQYYQAYHNIRQACRSLVDPGLWRKYMSQVQVSQALYYDFAFETMEHQAGKELYTPEERLRRWERAVYHALRSSDRYVWLYNEKVDFWQGRWGKLPDGFVEVIRSARGKLADE